MSEVIFMYIYDSNVNNVNNVNSLQNDKIDHIGLTSIDIAGNPDIIQKLEIAGILRKLPLFIINFKNESKVYPYNDENLKKIMAKIEELSK